MSDHNNDIIMVPIVMISTPVSYTASGGCHSAKYFTFEVETSVKAEVWRLVEEASGERCLCAVEMSQQENFSLALHIRPLANSAATLLIKYSRTSHRESPVSCIYPAYLQH